MKIAVQVYSVREHIKDTETLLKALEEIKQIVPKTTYDYLVERYKREHPNG